MLIIFRMLQHLLVNDNNNIIMLGFVFTSSSVKETVHYLKIVRAIKAVFLVMMSSVYYTYICTYIDTGTYCDCVKL